MRAGFEDRVMKNREFRASIIHVATEIGGAVRDFGEQRFDEIGGDRVFNHREEVVTVGVKVRGDTIQLFGFGSHSGVKSGSDDGWNVIDGGLKGHVLRGKVRDAFLETGKDEVVTFEARLHRSTDVAFQLNLSFQL